MAVETKVKRKIEDILLEKKLVSREDLEKAKEVQRVSGDSLGNLLVRMGVISQPDMTRAYAQQWDIPYVNLEDLKLNIEVIKTIPQSLAQRHKVIATSREDKELTVAMVNPLNVFAIDDLRLVTGLKIKPVFATEDQIVRTITEYYGIKMSMSQIMEEEELASVTADVDLEVLQVAAGEDDLALGELKKLVEEAPVVRLVNVIIARAVQDKASDIHVEPERRELRVRYRIDGILHDVMAPPKGIQPLLISRLKIMAGMDIAERRVPQDGRIQLVVEGREFDFRVSTYPTIFGEKVVMRILDKSGGLIGLNRLGFQSETQAMLEELVDNPYGILLSTGPTGSGKTTTLYSVLNKLNTIEKNIITIEDPIEYQMDGVNQIQINEKAGLRFDNGLRHLLRQDPDIIMVGEIRDFETAEIAVKAALTGHLVLSTLHTNDAPGTISRLLNMGIEPFLVAASVILIASQRLTRKVCTECKEEEKVPVPALVSLGFSEEEAMAMKCYKGKGCPACNGSGYKGRIALYEVMPLKDELKELILEGASADELKKTAIRLGMKTLRTSGLTKIKEGITSIEEVMRVTFGD